MTPRARKRRSDPEVVARALSDLRAHDAPCPCEGCSFQAKSRNSLLSHLYREHHKGDLVDALVMVCSRAVVVPAEVWAKIPYAPRYWDSVNRREPDHEGDII